MEATRTVQIDGTTKRQRYELLRSSLLQERSSFDSHWTELAQYIRPRRTRFFTTDRNRGDKRNSKIIDSTATFAARTLQSGMHAGLSSPARPWIKLTIGDPELAEFGPVKEWLHILTRNMLTLFQRSNVYNALPILYGDTGLFATGAMAVIEDDQHFMRCYSYPVGSYALGVSARGVVDTFVREWQMTVQQIVENFAVRDPKSGSIDWDKSGISTTVKNMWDTHNLQAAVDVTWLVTPNLEYDPTKLHSKYARWASCHFEKGQEQDGKFLRESGFFEFPIIAPRWEITGSEDIYGTDCPGMTCLGDVKALQLMQKKKAQAVEKMINPPLQAPTHLRNQKVSMLPGDLSFVDTTQHQQGIRPIHEVQMKVGELTADIQDTRYLIRRAFYEDLFLMLAQSEGTDMTAREIEERHEEKLLALGPVLEQMKGEGHDPLVDRAYAMMERGGMIPEPPEELHGMNLNVEYISLLAQAQKLVGASGQDRFFRSIVPLMQEGLFPEARYKVNIFQAVDDYGDMFGVSPKTIVPDDQAQAQFQAAQQAAARQQQMEQQALAAKSMRDLGQTPADTDSALSRMMEGS
jgi:hypothetical protein